MSEVCVVGLGYVGLTLSVALAKKGNSVTGVDSSVLAVNKISSGVSPFYDSGLSEALNQVLADSSFNVRNNTSNIQNKFDFIIIAIGSPLSSDRTTDLNNFLEILDGIQGLISDSSILILRSTIPVGTSRLLQNHLFRLGISCKVAFCPERTIEGRAYMELFELPQVVSGYDDSTVDKAGQLFKTLTDKIVNVQTLETAELVKLASNMWRDYSFSFANELFMSTENLPINIIEVINAANLHYPRSAIPLPGAVGGPCLTKDTYIFSQSISRNEHLFANARIVNENFPRAVVSRLKFRTEESIGIIGWAFKGNPRTTDLRFSPTLNYLDLILELMPKVTSIKAWDPESIDTDQRPLNVEWCDSFSELLATSSSIIVANNHPYFKSDDFLDLLALHGENLTIADLWGLIPKDRVLNQNIEILDLGDI